MACPYAEQIKGTIAKCSLLNKKVSTMRYPCKGNYRRCPVYIRRGVQRELPKPVEETTPKQEAPPTPAPPPTPRVKKPEAPAPRVEKQPVKVERPSEKPVEMVKPKPAPVESFKPSKALCDSLILASLTVSSKAEGIYRGPLNDLLDQLRSHLSDDTILLVVGDYDEYKIRLLFKGKSARYSLEKGGQPICGDEARELLEKLGLEKKLDGVIYSVKLSDIPLWKEQILEELS